MIRYFMHVSCFSLFFFFFFLMIRRPPRSTLFPYHDALPISRSLQSVLIGGKGRDPVGGLALDHAGSLFASGATSSSDFPLKNPLQAHLGGELDGFLMKLRLSDWSLLFSTYLGGSKLDLVMAVALDSAGNPIVSGTTASDDFPTTPGAYQRQRRGNYDAFVTKLDRDGERIIWSTHYGGSTEGPGPYDNGSMAVDEHGRVWIDGFHGAGEPHRAESSPARRPCQRLASGRKGFEPLARAAANQHDRRRQHRALLFDLG